MANTADTTNPPAKRKCSMEDCKRASHALGFCKKHYERFRVTGTAASSLRSMDREREKGVCSVDGCEKRDGRFTRGMCNMHYLRKVKHGDPNTLRQVPNGTLAQWLKQHVNYVEPDCLEWPFGRDPSGYSSHCRLEGRAVRGHRAMCILVHGKPPFPKAEAAHSCGNGHLGCVNPTHLSWKTHAENMADMAEHNLKRKS